MIIFENVSFSYPDIDVLNNVSFKLEDGKFIGILGPNGGGKSTFLKLALDLIKPTDGKIIRTDKKVSYVAQTTSISDSSFPASVEEVIYLGLVNNKIDFHYFKNKKKVEEIMKELSIYDLRKKLVNELSGGQLQKVKIAKAIISDPTLLVLDEPDAGMDDDAHSNLIRLINELHHKKTTILFVSHHEEDLKEADQIYFIEKGSILTYEDELKRGHQHANI